MSELTKASQRLRMPAMRAGQDVEELPPAVTRRALVVFAQRPFGGALTHPANLQVFLASS